MAKRMGNRTQSALAKAIRNVIAEGDTDVLPFPVENFLFQDRREQVSELVGELDNEFDSLLKSHPPNYQRALVPVGYTGFRWVYQIDPLWNLYYLTLCLRIANDIEACRQPVSTNRVFSYRYRFDETRGHVFDRGIGYAAFAEECSSLAAGSKYVVSCDIAAFYDSVYHHRLENALTSCTKDTDAVKRIDLLLFKFAGGSSYGLPVGGNASRLLAEALLIQTDRSLVGKNIKSCRFVDDIRLFANTRDEAYAALHGLASLLGDTLGLRLQKSKTVILRSSEFLKSEGTAGGVGDQPSPSPETREFLNLRLRFDPYSPTADEDYEELQKQIRQFNVVGILASEIGKSRIQMSLVRKLVTSLRYVDEAQQARGALALIDNVKKLFPVFPQIATVTRRLMDNNNSAQYGGVHRRWRELFKSSGLLARVEPYAAYAVRVLAIDPDGEAERLLVQRYESAKSQLLKRELVYALTRRRAVYWLDQAKSEYRHMSPWEQRAIYMASVLLNDGGRHWRRNVASDADRFAELMREWFGKQLEQSDWELPV